LCRYQHMWYLNQNVGLVAFLWEHEAEDWKV
jgi:hypothetical protein